MQQSEPEVSPIDWEAQSRQSMQALGSHVAEKEREEKEYYKEYLASRREKEGHTRTE